MTIKPVPSSKRGNGNDGDNNNKKESQGKTECANVVGQGHRLDGHGHGHGHGRQSPLQIFDDLARGLRGSPHKRLRFSSSRSKRRDYEHTHSHSHKRNERVDKHNTSMARYVNVPLRPLDAQHIAAASSRVSSGHNSPAQSGGSSPEQHHTLLPPKLALMAARNAAEEKLSGYNSGDEHVHAAKQAVSVEEWNRRGLEFEDLMKGQGYEVRRVEEDGACLFRSISLQIYGDEEMHDVVRQSTMNYIYENREYFSQFLTEDINSYVKRKRRKESHGNHIELQALSEIYSRPIEVYSYALTPMNIFNEGQRNNGYPPLRLSYERGSHYNAIIDPYNASVGVGLGLAGYKPQYQTVEAMQLSEQMEIEKTMFEDKLKTTDWEATNEEIEEQVARESYQQYCRETLNRARGGTHNTNTATSTATVTSAQAALNDCEPSPSPSPSKYHTKSSSLPNDDVGTVSLTAKTLSQFAHNQNIDMSGSITGGGYESDGTDISSTSSVSVCGGNKSPQNNAAKQQLNKHSKTRRKRGATFRLKNKRRCDDIMTSEQSADTCGPLRKSPKRDAAANTAAAAANAAAAAAAGAVECELELKPSTSKQSNSSTQSQPNELKPSSAASPPKNENDNTDTSFYDELLAASYASDDFNESEMLQRAIQLSTQDYFAEQQRKYYCGGQ